MSAGSSMLKLLVSHYGILEPPRIGTESLSQTHTHAAG